MKFIIEKTKFANGVFREAIKATAKHEDGQSEIWMIKKYTEESIQMMKDTLQITPE